MELAVKPISNSQSQYLEAIYAISKEKPCVRTTDIAERLGLSKPSVNKAVASLKAKGYVTHLPYGSVSLTEKGKSFGDFTGRKSSMIKKFLVSVLNLSEHEAETEAVSIGNIVSYNTVEKMISFMEA